jgi:hypothetical protein
MSRSCFVVVMAALLCLVLLFVTGCAGKLAFEVATYYPDSWSKESVGDPRAPSFQTLQVVESGGAR